MLYANQLRGNHGTGVFYNNSKKKQSAILKMAEPASTFINTQIWGKKEEIIFKNSTFVVGHNRYATMGKHIYKDTYPFREGNITLVHNGTLTSHKDLADVEIDSHAICHSIASIGAKETIAKIKGAFALVWYNKDENTLSLIRNVQRPLHLIETAGCWFISSELELAQWVCKRNMIPIVSFKLLPAGDLHTVNLDTLTIEQETIPMYVEKYDYPYQKTVWDKTWEKDYTKKHTYSTDNLWVGKNVTLEPVSIEYTGKIPYLLCYDNDVYSNIEVRFYHINVEFLEELEMSDTIAGYISSEVSHPQQGHYYTVRDVKIVTNVTPMMKLIGVQ